MVEGIRSRRYFGNVFGVFILTFPYHAGKRGVVYLLTNIPFLSNFVEDLRAKEEFKGLSSTGNFDR